MRYINSHGILKNFWTVAIVMEDTKPPIIQISTILQVERFWLRPNWKNWALYSRRKVSCNKEEIQY